MLLDRYSIEKVAKIIGLCKEEVDKKGRWKLNNYHFCSPMSLKYFNMINLT